MTYLTTALKKPTYAALAAIFAFSLTTNAHAQDSEIAAPEDLYDKRLPYSSTYSPSNNVPNSPQGFSNDFQYTRVDGEGANITSKSSYRYTLDYANKYVNTSGPENITIVDISSGIQGGIRLGCDGLDLGLEALTQFKFGDILDNLPKYITTQLAVEALAQIYATPLVSTVMDGLKAMQNFTAQFTQANCDMNKVMDRANEIKAANYQDCIEEIGTGTRVRDGDEISAHEYCADPHGLDKWLNDKKEWFGQKTAIADNLAKILPDGVGDAAGADYEQPKYELTPEGYKLVSGSGSETGPQGRMPSKGRWLAMFIPNVKFTASSSSSNSTRASTAEITPAKIYDRSKVSARNYIIDTFNEIRDLVRSHNINGTQYETMVFYAFNKYKGYVIGEYGSKTVFEDNDANNKDPISDIAAVQAQYAKSSEVVYNTFTTDSGKQKLLIGPADGPTDTLADTDTDLRGSAKDMLELGNVCWAKNKFSGDTYYWEKIQDSPSALLNMRADNVGDMIDKVTKCVIADSVNFVLYNAHYNKFGNDPTMIEAYLDYLSYNAAITATETYIKSADFLSDDVIATAHQRLKEECMKETSNGTNMSGAGNLAVYDGSSGQEFKSCDDYAKQLGLTEDKITELNIEKEKRKEQLAILKEKSKKAASTYFELRNLHAPIATSQYVGR